MSITINTPLADALGDAVRDKLIEIGWSMAGEDSPLSEYIGLMLVNGKTREQIADELSGDLLGLPKEDRSATHFATWLFDKVDELKAQFGEDGGVSSSGGSNQQQQYEQQGHDGSHHDADQQGDDGNMDVEMGDGSSLNGAPPTGPKAMRNGPRKDRLFNQLNKHLERQPGDSSLRPRTQGGDRISKQPPKGPRNQHNARGGIGGPMGGRGGGRGGHMGRGGSGNFNATAALPPALFPPQLTAQLNNMNPQQQLAFFNMIEQQNQILANFVPGMQPNPPMVGQPHGGPNGFRGPPNQGQFPNQQNAYQGRNQGSLFDRIEKPQRSQSRGGYAQSAGQDADMDMGKDAENAAFFEDTEGNSAPAHDQSLVACKFANGCAKPECPFAHPTPGAVGNANITFTEKCSYGVKCKNRKCVGAHPSPASAPDFQPIRAPTILADCKFFPNCKNPVCPFRHPEMPLCRNGKSCTRPDCHFTHADTPACKFNPCLNPNCIYTHTEGQQQGKFENKIWTAGGKREHVSERKFQTEEADMEEELIIPGQQPQKRTIQKASNGSDDVPPGSAGSTNSSHTMNADMDAIQEDTDMPA